MKALGFLMMAAGVGLLICSAMDITLTTHYMLSTRLVGGLGIAIALGGLLVYQG
jgi:hypothetical protein